MIVNLSYCYRMFTVFQSCIYFSFAFCFNLRVVLGGSSLFLVLFCCCLLFLYLLLLQFLFDFNPSYPSCCCRSIQISRRAPNLLSMIGAGKTMSWLLERVYPNLFLTSKRLLFLVLGFVRKSKPLSVDTCIDGCLTAHTLHSLREFGPSGLSGSSI